MLGPDGRRDRGPVQKDSEGTAIALEMIASISMVQVGDAQKATQLIAEKKIKKFTRFP